jgi:glycerol-3-phosphate dehydrogenase
VRPIVDAVVQVLDGRLAPEQALEQLLRRDARAEGL